jgi:protein-tyrosine phosphatase
VVKKRTKPNPQQQAYVVGYRDQESCWLLPVVEGDEASDQNLDRARRFELLSDAVAVSLEHDGGNIFEVVQDHGKEVLREIKVDLEAVRSAPYEGCYLIIKELIAAPTFLCLEEAETHSRIMALRKANVRVIVSLVEEELFPMREQLEAIHFDELFEQHYFPIVDRGVPTIDFMRLILDTIDRALDASKTVLVHCVGGRGRTGLVASCFLARHGLATGIEALNKLTEIRLAHGLFEPSPETKIQKNFSISWKEGE